MNTSELLGGVDPVLKKKVDQLKKNINDLINRSQNKDFYSNLPRKKYICIKCNCFRDKYLYMIPKKQEGNNTDLDLYIQECTSCHHKRVLVIVNREKGYGLQLGLFIAKLLYEPFLKTNTEET